MARTKRTGTPSVCNLLSPVKVDHLLMLADKLVKGEKPTVGEVNGGRFTAEELAALWGEPIMDGDTVVDYTPDSMNHALFHGHKRVPAVPALHQPVLLLAAKTLGMTFAFAGQEARNTKQPSNWASHLPTWKPGMNIGVAGGRGQALKDVRRNVVDERYLATVGSYDYIVGDDKANAVFVVNGSKGASTYGFNVRAIKRLAFRGREADIANIVFQINNSIVTERWVGDRTIGAQVVFLPDMLATAGYLVRDGNVLTYAQIAKAIADEDTKNIRFKALEAPIVGNSVTRAQLLAMVRKMMQAAATKNEEGHTAWDIWLDQYKGNEDNALQAIWYNATVQTRNSPAVLFCFGLRNAVLDQPLAMVYGDDTSDKRITCIIGQRCGDETTFNSREAVREAARAEAEAARAEAEEMGLEEVSVPRKSKPKAKAKAKKESKPKAAKTPKAPKAKSKDKSKPKSKKGKGKGKGKPTATEESDAPATDTPVPTELTDTADDEVSVEHEVPEIEAPEAEVTEAEVTEVIETPDEVTA